MQTILCPSTRVNVKLNYRMRILVSNDDGILSDGLWALVGKLSEIGQVLVSAPDREQSAIGTAVTLRQSLKVQKVKPILPGIETYSVEGTPSDAVILALGKLIKGKTDVVVSGINQGMNLGEDVYISGTVGAALQGYLRGYPAIAVSASYKEGQYLDGAARVAALIAEIIGNDPRLADIFLNVNMPGLPLEKIKGARITKPAGKSHINTVEEGNHGWHKYYWLVRQRLENGVENGTDVAAVEQGYISISPLRLDRTGKINHELLNEMCRDIELALDIAASAL